MSLFEKLACQLVGVPPDVMEATFIKGLKTDLRAAIRVTRPEGLAHAMELAITIEDNQQFEAVTRTGVSNFRSNTASFSGYNRSNGPVSSHASASSVRSPVSTSTVRSGTNIRPGQFKRLTEAELADSLIKDQRDCALNAMKSLL